jgi:hypothetical protein
MIVLTFTHHFKFLIDTFIHFFLQICWFIKLFNLTFLIMRIKSNCVVIPVTHTLNLSELIIQIFDIFIIL